MIKLFLFVVLLLVIGFQRGIFAQEDDVPPEEEEGDVMDQMMVKFTTSILKTFPSPLKMDDINLNVFVGPLASFDGRLTEVYLDGFTTTKINASNIDITEFALDLTVKVDEFILKGVIELNGYAAGFVPLALSVNLKVKINDILTDSIEGTGKIKMQKLTIDVFPQTLTLIVATFAGLFIAVAIGFFCGMNGYTIYKKYYKDNQVQLMKSENPIMTMG